MKEILMFNAWRTLGTPMLPMINLTLAVRIIMKGITCFKFAL